MSKHTCHAHGCPVDVPPRMLMCSRHWYSLPKPIQRAVWLEYRSGQEIDKRPSLRYLAVQQLAVASAAFRPHDEAAATIAAGYLGRAIAYQQQAIERGLGDPLAGLVPEQLDGALVGKPAPQSGAQPRARSLMLFDANNFAHRCWHASDNRPPHESFGFALQRLIRKVAPSFALAVWDGEGPTWRHQEYPGYKADRPPAPEGFGVYVTSVRAELEGAGVRSIEVARIEADDLIASYAEAATRIGVNVAVVSSDKDLAQLVRDEGPGGRVELVEPNGRRWKAADVRERWKVWPHSLPDLLALAGDSSDSIPGAPGIGPVNAAKLIADHGDLEQILDRVELVSKPSIRKALKASAEQLRLFLRLTTLRRDVPLPVPVEAALLRRGAGRS